MENKDYIYIDKNEDNFSDNTHQTKFIISKTSKIDYLIDNEKYDEALSLIEKTLEKSDFKYWNLKGVIYDEKKEYAKAVESYNKALSIKENIDSIVNKANALYKWAKITYFPEMEYEKALSLITEALETVPESEDSSEYYFLKGEILEALMEYGEAKKAYLIAYGEFDKVKELENQIEYISTTNDTLINITGVNHYNFSPEQGIVVDLIKENENEHDCDAIAVFLDNEKIGYVANSSYTLFEGVESATQIKNLNPQKAQILFVYLDDYIVAKIIESD